MQVGNSPALLTCCKVEASESNIVGGDAKAKLRNYTLIKLYAKKVDNLWATEWPVLVGYFYQNLVKFLILSRPFSPAAARHLCPWSSPARSPSGKPVAVSGSLC